MEIEFIEHRPPDPVPGDLAPPVGRRRPPVLGLAGVLVFGATAALAAVTPFQRLYTVRISVTGFLERLSVDGWGRTALTVSTGDTTPQHGPRYGIVFAVLGGVCVLLAIAAAALVLRAGRSVLDVILVAAGAVTAAAFATAVALTWLEVESRLDNARELSKPRVGETLAEHISVHTSYESGLWLGIVATGGALAGTALWALHVRAAARIPSSVPDLDVPAGPAEADAAGQDGDERLSW